MAVVVRRYARGKRFELPESDLRQADVKLNRQARYRPYGRILNLLSFPVTRPARGRAVGRNLSRPTASFGCGQPPSREEHSWSGLRKVVFLGILSKNRLDSLRKGRRLAAAPLALVLGYFRIVPAGRGRKTRQERTCAAWRGPQSSCRTRLGRESFS